MSGLATRCELELPAWVGGFVERWGAPLDSPRAGMRLAIALATQNIEHDSGGPFAAVVLDEAARRVVAVGVNQVTASGLSIAHAEIVALSLAQQRLGDWNLAREARLTLVTTCEPCAMCFGALPWSGVRRLVCGARQEDAEAAGFDEGDKPADWVASLVARGIEVERDVLRTETRALFGAYRRLGGEIYNVGADGAGDS
ncbi:MAG: nucleoside deaminase [Xanthomonadales bacterium]|nr:nucleoside deaminase [Xanthomonadales bacterium]NIN60780.1 nucleoside deaminase [Xanthomonadales bacterium]NIN76142.1 nucleoside deaminase [Xanthomonadales bacterium]NIO15363.1 nucleoside deaminase [Xanthomonadales bacterium]NIP13173.1 nucleoside deaminase [Xanthomonadales bacterium]